MNERTRTQIGRDTPPAGAPLKRRQRRATGCGEVEGRTVPLLIVAAQLRTRLFAAFPISRSRRR